MKQMLLIHSSLRWKLEVYKAFKQLVQGYTIGECKPGFEPVSLVPEPIVSYRRALSRTPTVL